MRFHEATVDLPEFCKENDAVLMYPVNEGHLDKIIQFGPSYLVSWNWSALKTWFVRKPVQLTPGTFVASLVKSSNACPA